MYKSSVTIVTFAKFFILPWSGVPANLKIYSKVFCVVVIFKLPIQAIVYFHE